MIAGIVPASTSSVKPSPEDRSVLVTAQDVRRGKPAPDGYLLAASRLGVAPGDAVVFEDAPVGVAAGLAGGSAVVGVATTYAPEQLQGSTVVVANLTRVMVERDANCWRILVYE